MNRFTIFGHQQCGFCRRAKEELERRELPFRYVDIHQESISHADLSKTVGKPVYTVPQIFNGHEYVGGYEALMKYLDQQVA